MRTTNEITSGSQGKPRRGPNEPTNGRRLTRKARPNEAWIGAVEARLRRPRNRYIGDSKLTCLSMPSLDLARLESIQRIVERRTGAKPSRSVIIGAALEALEETLG